jgi:hypothetical protein
LYLCDEYEEKLKISVIPFDYFDDYHIMQTLKIKYIIDILVNCGCLAMIFREESDRMGKVRAEDISFSESL